MVLRFYRMECEQIESPKEYSNFQRRWNLIFTYIFAYFVQWNLFDAGQVLSQAQGSYLSIDDVSFDPSFDDVSSSCVQRSSRSSLAGTSVTSAAEISTVSVAASQRLLEAEEDVHSTLSRNSVVSLDKDGQQTPTVVTECAVIHFQRQPSNDEPPLDVSLPSQVVG